MGRGATLAKIIDRWSKYSGFAQAISPLCYDRHLCRQDLRLEFESGPRPIVAMNKHRAQQCTADPCADTIGFGVTHASEPGTARGLRGRLFALRIHVAVMEARPIVSVPSVARLTLHFSVTDVWDSFGTPLHVLT